MHQTNYMKAERNCVLSYKALQRDHISIEYLRDVFLLKM